MFRPCSVPSTPRPQPAAGHLARPRQIICRPARPSALALPSPNPLLGSRNEPVVGPSPRVKPAASEQEEAVATVDARQTMTTPDTTMIELSPSNFEQILAGDNLVLVDFYTDYCGPCKLMHSHFEKLQSIFKKIRFVKYNCGLEGHEPLATRQRIRSLPTFRLYHTGKFLEEVTGARPVQLRQMLVHYHR